MGEEKMKGSLADYRFAINLVRLKRWLNFVHSRYCRWWFRREIIFLLSKRDNFSVSMSCANSSKLIQSNVTHWTRFHLDFYWIFSRFMKLSHNNFISLSSKHAVERVSTNKKWISFIPIDFTHSVTLFARSRTIMAFFSHFRQ
jgi:hypothetical protein